MASSNNRANKQKRQRENRQRRQVRSARSAHAGEATSVSEGRGEAATPMTSSRTTGAQGAGKPSRTRRPGNRAFTIPGQRAVVMAFLFALVSAGTLLLVSLPFERDLQPDDPRVVEDLDEGEEPDVNKDGTVTIFEDAKLVDEVGTARSAALVLVPLAITGAAVAFTKRPQRSTAWTMAMIAMAGYVFFIAGPIGAYVLPALIALAVGGFQSRRAEQKVRLAEIAARKRSGVGDGGDVIEGRVVSERASGSDDDDAASGDTGTDAGGDDG